MQLVRLACINVHSDGAIFLFHKENANLGGDPAPEANQTLRLEGQQKTPPKNSITTESSIPVRLDESTFAEKGINLFAGEPDCGGISEHIRDVIGGHLADGLG